MSFHHPEQKKDEEFLGNFTQLHFRDMPFVTKRIGEVPYDRNGQPLNGSKLHPVFIWRDEE